MRFLLLDIQIRMSSFWFTSNVFEWNREMILLSASKVLDSGFQRGWRFFEASRHGPENRFMGFTGKPEVSP